MSSLRSIGVVLALFLLASTSVFAQGTTSSLGGRVEHGGENLPGVTVTISSPSMQGVRVTTTDINGSYVFPSIPPGDYTVTFEMDGLAPIARTVQIGLAKTERVNADMQLTSVTSSITVTAAAPAVIETTEIQSNYNEEVVEQLPIGRTVRQITEFAPGVSSTGPGSTRANPVVTISGAASFDSLFLINGAVTNENLRGQTDDLFIEDAIEETSVMTGSISAEFGRFTGGVVSAITKSGGNEFSGSFRDSFSDPSWDETTPFGEPQDESSLNEVYEATLGGFIVRDRLWFFTAGRYFEQSIPGFFTNSTIALPTTVQTDERYEVKLTGQIGQNHSLVGSYLDYTVDQTPHCAFGCWNIETMDLNGRQLPREMITANYSGVVSSNFLVEAGYSTRDLVFAGSGGDYVTQDPNDPHDLALGSWAYDNTYGGAWGAPIFCGVCGDEARENEYYNVKGTYYLATAGLGSHNLVAGYENFAESRLSNNYQSGSNLQVYTYSGIEPTRTASGELRPVVAPGDTLFWSPILTLSEGSDFVTDSFFVNDKWDLNSQWSFNLGVRYDKNDGADSAGNPISKDDNLSPRLGLIYDIGGDGRYRLNAGYSKYVSRIQEGVGGAGGGGNPAYFLFEYQGPEVGGPDSGLGPFDVLEEVYTWFLNACDDEGNCGYDNGDLLFFAGVPGVNQRFPGDLLSPSVDEITLGFGTQIGTKGFFRADVIDRDWSDFYAVSTTPGDIVNDPVVGELDIVTYGNTNDLERSYQALQLQANYRVMPRLNLGGNYTWSETKGNTEGENRGSGPLADVINTYTEYKGYSQHNPVGLLLSDQTHKARLWASYDQPLGSLGNLNVTLLERYESGTPYSASANVDVGSYVDNPGYATSPSTLLYYFSDRGEYRWEDVTATDLALNWVFNIGQFDLFVQGDIINLFNESAQVNGSTAVTVLSCDEGQTSGCADFNPFTETPVEGVHWEKRANFGQATSSLHYQFPRTYQLSAGLRF